MSSTISRTQDLRRVSGVFRSLPYITDASAIPAALTVNPSLTVAALAERASTFVLQRLADLGVTSHHDIPIPR
ncbi:GMC oxidoreductase [Catellatospora sp. NPDC049609]|uniref:GMC oxidoreductase n=1 Tax=Catellatospora sp. NPDC049609 TaxID=3155505 RepID=UPI0034263B8B